MDVDPAPADEPPSQPDGPGPAAAAEVLRETGAAMRLGFRCHPVTQAAIVSDFVVRAVHIAAALNRGLRGDLDLPLIRALARDLEQDLACAREYGRVRDLSISLNAAHVFALDQAFAQVSSHGPEPRILTRYCDAALRLVRQLVNAVGAILRPHHGSHLASYGGADLEAARTLAEVFHLQLCRSYSFTIYGYLSPSAEAAAREHVLVLARERSRALDSVCRQNLAGRLDIGQLEGLAAAILEGALDDFTDADLTNARLADADLSGIRWSLAGTSWPPGTNVKAIQARSEEVPPGSGVLVFRRPGMMWQPAWG